LRLRRLLSHTLFPYTTLFRSPVRGVRGDRLRAAGVARWRVGGLVRALRLPFQRVAGVMPDHPPGLGEDAEDRTVPGEGPAPRGGDRKSTRLNSSHVSISYAVF